MLVKCHDDVNGGRPESKKKKVGFNVCLICSLSFTHLNDTVTLRSGDDGGDGGGGVDDVLVIEYLIIPRGDRQSSVSPQSRLSVINV